MAIIRYEFTNFSDEAFTGRYNGVDYTFSPSETRSFDPDKHYMLILMSKQLADRELLKRIKNVGRDPKDMETWGKSLDEYGKPFAVTADMRKILMRQAIGDLADTPVPTPEEQREEAGTTQEASKDVKELQTQVKELTEMVQSLTGILKSQQQPAPTLPTASVIPDEPVRQPSLTRSALEDMAKEAGVENVETLTKEELIHAVAGRQAQL